MSAGPRSGSSGTGSIFVSAPGDTRRPGLVLRPSDLHLRLRQAVFPASFRTLGVGVRAHANPKRSRVDITSAKASSKRGGARRLQGHQPTHQSCPARLRALRSRQTAWGQPSAWGPGGALLSTLPQASPSPHTQLCPRVTDLRLREHQPQPPHVHPTPQGEAGLDSSSRLGPEHQPRAEPPGPMSSPLSVPTPKPATLQGWEPRPRYHQALAGSILQLPAPRRVLVAAGTSRED